MLTLFTCPKPFKGHIALIQRNALTSWTRLRPRPEIILFGNEEGAAETGRELGLRHVPEIAYNEFGTPLLHDIFQKAQQMAGFRILGFVNTDIILMSDFSAAVPRVLESLSDFLLLGQRWDVEMTRPWDFDSPDWEARLRDYAIRSRPPGPLWGLADYFVFPRGFWSDMPPFAVGRTAWDNWLIYRARARRRPVIDASAAIMAVHQKHDYAHQALRPVGWADSAQGIESKRNRVLSGGDHYNQFGLYDVTHRLTPTALQRALGWKYLMRYIDTAPVLFPSLAPLIWVPRFRKLSARVFAKTVRLVKRGPALGP